jgi:hypothetical protein
MMADSVSGGILADVSFEEGEIRVAEAMVALHGAEAAAMCREIAATCEAEGDHVCRDSFLRFAGYAEKALAVQEARTTGSATAGHDALEAPSCTPRLDTGAAVR